MKKTAVLSVAVVLACGIRSQGATYTWTGGNSSGAQWTAAANWGLPTAPSFLGSVKTSDVLFSSTGAKNLDTFVGNYTVTPCLRSLTFNSDTDSNITIRLTTTATGTTAKDMILAADSGNARVEVQSGSAGSHTVGVAVTGTKISLWNNLDIIHNGSGTLTFGTAIDDYLPTVHQAINISGSGTVIFSADMTNSANRGFNGGLNLNGGTLRVVYRGSQRADNRLGGVDGAISFDGGTLEFAGTNSTLEVVAAARSTTINAGGGTILVSNAASTIMWDGVIAGTGALAKTGDGTLMLNQENTYLGDTGVITGTLSLSDHSGLTFKIGEDGVNNRVYGDGTVNFDGAFIFDLTEAGTGGGNSWDIVTAANRDFGSNFFVQDFTRDGDVLWTRDIDGEKYYQFSQSTGVLSVIPEPATLTLIGIMAAGMPVFRRFFR